MKALSLWLALSFGYPCKTATAPSVSTVQIRLFPDGRMCAKDASDYVGLSEKTMAMMRCKGTGPRFVKRGRIFYFKTDLDDWLQKGIAQTTAQCAKR